MILKKEPYQVMVSGEKNEEFRENTAYWRSRLYEKDETPKKFSYVEFSNGYQKNRPQFMVEFKGIEIIDEVDRSYSTGFKVKYPYKKEGYIKIMLGNVLNGQKKEQEKEKKEPEGAKEEEENEAGAKEESETDLIARAAKIVAGEDELAAMFLVRFDDPVFAALSKAEMIQAVRGMKAMGGKNGKQWLEYVLNHKEKMEEVINDLRKKKKKTKTEAGAKEEDAGAYDYTKEEEQLVETFVRGNDLSRFDAETIKWLSQPGLISKPQAPSCKKKK